MKDYRFGNFLREQREKNLLSQYQLGLLLGVSDKAVSKWENGISKPQSRVLYKLSEILGISIDELLACKYHSLTRKGVFAMKKELWEKARNSLKNHYGESPSLAIINRFASEKAELDSTEAIVFLDAIAELYRKAREQKKHIRINGSVGASFVAFLLGATSVNPLASHYYCKTCKKIEFCKDAKDAWDLPIKICVCGNEMQRDGHDIPFEAFRGYEKPYANYIVSVDTSFFETAKEILQSYFEACNMVIVRKETEAHTMTFGFLSRSVSEDTRVCTYKEYLEKRGELASITLTANKQLDLYAVLEQYTNTSFDRVPFLDNNVLFRFLNKNTRGIHEFESKFIRDLTDAIKPQLFSDLYKMLGLAHGNGTWLEQDKTDIKNMIAYREDVFSYVQEKMLRKGYVHFGFAYDIMEQTRKGIFAKKGIDDKTLQYFNLLEVDERFINSIQKIRYLFPKAHGIQCTREALILMWYKINHPHLFEQLAIANKV